MSAPGTAWQDHAACAGTDVDFFPERGESLVAARAICARCPVSDECLAYALDNDERFGIWGGLSERQRRALRRERKGPRVLRPIVHGTEGGYRTHLRRGEEACEACRVASRVAHRARKLSVAAS